MLLVDCFYGSSGAMVMTSLTEIFSQNIKLSRPDPETSRQCALPIKIDLPHMDVGPVAAVANVSDFFLFD